MSHRIVPVAIAIIERRGRYFLQRRAAGSRLFAGLWEFPGGKLEAGEKPGDAVIRELDEELAWIPARVKELPVLEHTYPDLRVRIHPFHCPCHRENDELPKTDLAWGWFTLETLKALPLPDATRVLAETLR